MPPHLDSVLRGYQPKDGVAWMRFYAYGFGGVLADDMGLGKTVQVLAALSARSRRRRKARRVAHRSWSAPRPRFTWKQEAKFTRNFATSS